MAIEPMTDDLKLNLLQLVDDGKIHRINQRTSQYDIVWNGQASDGAHRVTRHITALRRAGLVASDDYGARDYGYKLTGTGRAEMNRLTALLTQTSPEDVPAGPPYGMPGLRSIGGLFVEDPEIFPYEPPTGVQG